ncbi:hypothetical protein L596_005664 [Steinernema carpocapsae]|uniref:Uncharacterized protein n=1 Tax=Steinernema carpocapsae TaxID=34508 RepID=A0A4U8V175_STECR|nr:hypothetical protein L596_005664 [Steinernema carpocapsae]
MKGLLDAHSRYLPRAGLASKNVLVKNKDGLYRGLVISIDGLSVASVFLVDEGAIDRVHIDKLRDFSGHWVTQLPLQVLPICLPALDYYAPQNIKELLDNAFHSGFIYISREPDVSNPDNLVICPRIMLTDYLGQVDLLDMYFTHPDQVMPFDHVPNLRHYVLEEM